MRRINAESLPTAALASAVLFALLLSACIPINVSELRVVPETFSESVAADWDPTVGPDLHMAFAFKFKNLLRDHSARIEIIDADTFWSAIVPPREPGTVAKVSEILTRDSLARMSELDARFLVVLGTETPPVRRVVTELVAFYSSTIKESTREAVLIDVSGDARERLKFSAKAAGEEKEGWIPGTPLMFARLYQTVDTEGSALDGVAARVVEHVLRGRGDSSVRLAVLAAQ